MKRYISAILIPCLLLHFTACYSSLASGEDINDYLKSGNDLKFVLKNNNAIIAKSNDCKFITEPVYFVYGKGILIDKKNNNSINFNGEVQKETIDSVKSLTLDSQNYFVYWLKDSSRISFKENDVVSITPETTPNFWLIKEKGTDSYKIFYKKEIDEIQVEDRTANITLAIIGGAISVALLVSIIVVLSGATSMGNL